MINFGTIFYSPPAVSRYIRKAQADLSFQLKKNTDEEIRLMGEISCGAIAALIMYEMTGQPAYVQLYKPDPPDVIVRQMNIEDISEAFITLLEITDYLKSSSVSLLDQLKRKKIPESYDQFGEEYIIVVMIEPGALVDPEPLRQYMEKTKRKYPIWLIEQKQYSPHTVVELIVVNPVTTKSLVNVGRLAEEYLTRGYPNVFQSWRAGSKEKVRFEKTERVFPPPWETIGM